MHAKSRSVIPAVGPALAGVHGCDEPVKPIYVTVCNLDSVVSGKAAAWRVLGMIMMPSLTRRKSATLAQSDEWRKDCRLRLHHACFAHVVDMVSEDKHLLCADGQV